MDVRKLTDIELIDMLSEQTTILTRLLTVPLSMQDYQRCKLMINALAREIRARESSKAGETARDGDVFIRD
jgi:hypothetical protein